MAHMGLFGVDLFFALSACLITKLLLRERSATGRVNVQSFYIRRILRIWPLYFVFLAFMFCVSRVVYAYGDPLLIRDFIPASIGYFVALFFLFGNIAIAFWGAPTPVIGLLWSVCLEEQFYLLWPPVIRSASRRGIAGAAAMMLIVSIAARQAAAMLGYRGTLPVWCFTLTRLDPMAVGILLALVPETSFGRLGRLSRSLLVVAGLAGWWLAAGWFDVFSESAGALDMGLGYPAATLGCAVLLAAALGGGNFGNGGVVRRGLIYLGKISYGLYVYHSLAIALSRDLVFHLAAAWQTRFGQPLPVLQSYVLYLFLSFFLVVAAAACSYQWLEAPFLRLKRRFTLIPSRPV